MSTANTTTTGHPTWLRRNVPLDPGRTNIGGTDVAIRDDDDTQEGYTVMIIIMMMGKWFESINRSKRHVGSERDDIVIGRLMNRSIRINQSDTWRNDYYGYVHQNEVLPIRKSIWRDEIRRIHGSKWCTTDTYIILEERAVQKRGETDINIIEATTIPAVVLKDTYAIF